MTIINIANDEYVYGNSSITCLNSYFNMYSKNYINTDFNTVTELRCSWNETLKSLYGIHLFPNLEKLICNNCSIISLTDIKYCKKLKYIDCSHNAIISGYEELAKCEQLQILYMDDNFLTFRKILNNWYLPFSLKDYYIGNSYMTKCTFLQEIHFIHFSKKYYTDNLAINDISGYKNQTVNFYEMHRTLMNEIELFMILKDV